MALRVRSVHTLPGPADGLRLLCTRFRGRGLPATHYDVWMPNLAPSEKLLRSFQQGRINWQQFSRQYGQKFTLRLLRQLAQEGTVTLMCHCGEDEAHCHRHLLRSVVLSSRL